MSIVPEVFMRSMPDIKRKKKKRALTKKRKISLKEIYGTNSKKT